MIGLLKIILFLYFNMYFYINIWMTVFLLNEIMFISQNKQKIVQTLQKWLFFTSINLDIIKNKITLL